jgi:hypothetical protein
MADDPKSEKKAEGKKKKKPVDKSRTLLFRFARNVGRTARVIKVGSTWFLKKSDSAAPKPAKKKAAKAEKEAAAGITADVEAAVKAAEEEPEEEAAEEVTADVEAALKAAEEAAEE